MENNGGKLEWEKKGTAWYADAYFLHIDFAPSLKTGTLMLNHIGLWLYDVIVPELNLSVPI